MVLLLTPLGTRSSPSPPRCPHYWYFPKQKCTPPPAIPHTLGKALAGVTIEPASHRCLPSTRHLALCRGLGSGAAGKRPDHDQGHKGGRWPSPAVTVTALRTNPHPAPGSAPCPPAPHDQRRSRRGGA